MERKFKVLRIIGTVWKILAWIVLVLGVLGSIGVLLTSLFGGGLGMMGELGREYGMMPGMFSIVGGIVGSLFSLIGSVVYFLMLYGVGELIYLLLAIEENTRLSAQWIQMRAAAPPPAPAPPQAYAPPPPTPPTQKMSS